MIAADTFGSGIESDVVGPLAVDLALRLQTESSCRLEVATNLGTRLAIGVRVPDGHQRRILGCLMRHGELSAEGPSQMPSELAVCSGVSCTQRVDAPATLQFAITDTGIGIAPQAIPQLFNPFTQADSSASRKFSGTGLGLAISDRLAAMLGGHIEVESTLGEGSTFTLSIDVGSLQGVPMVDAPPKAPAGRDQSAAADQEVRLSGRVLLAEDGKDNQRLIGLILKKAGLEVDLAENGRIACQQAFASTVEGNPYDLILMDIQMPEMDGHEATRRLRQSGWQGSIVALTAHAMAGDREKCLQAGCDDYLTKPIERTTFLATLARYLPHTRSAPTDV